MNRFLLFLLISMLSLSVNIFPREYRGYNGKPDCCGNHSLNINHIDQSFNNYLHLIPTRTEPCNHVLCAECHHTWLATREVCSKPDDNEDEDEEQCIEEDVWMCECKVKEWIWDGTIMPSWYSCNAPSIYKGYFDTLFKKRHSDFFQYLKYVSENTACRCYWIEYSEKAKEINETAYWLFRILLENKPFEQLIEDVPTREAIFGILNTHGFALHCVVHSFFYSNYYQICEQLEYYANKHFIGKDRIKAIRSLNEIRITLKPLFLSLYKSCVQQHPHKRILYEMELITLRNE